MIDFDQLRLILWIVVGLLMAAGVAGLTLALLLDRRGSMAAEVVRPAKKPKAKAMPEAPSPPVDPRILAERAQKRTAAYRLGIAVFVGLAALTALEFWIAHATDGSAVFLFVMALVKAGIIIQYYMHLNSVWGEEEAH
jgi:hypothetical protein